MTPIAEVVQHLLGVADEAERAALLQQAFLSVDAEELLRLMKAEAERQWTIDPHASLRIAEALILGAALAERQNHHALGLMAKADALRCLGRYPESLEYFEASAREFQVQRDDVGWARTRIGWVRASQLVGRGPEVLNVAERAHEVLVRHDEWFRAAGLDLNTALVYRNLAQFEQALRIYDRALAQYAAARAADPAIGNTVDLRVAATKANKAFVLTLLGDFGRALPLHEEALRTFQQGGDLVSVLHQQHNIGQFHAGQGRYSQALTLMEEALAEAERAKLDPIAAWLAVDLSECYLRLNRAREALDMADDATATFERCGTAAEAAKARFLAAEARRRLGDSSGALELLQRASTEFNRAGLHTELAAASLERAQLWLAEGNWTAAQGEAKHAERLLAAQGLPVHRARAGLVRARACLALGSAVQARKIARSAAATARDHQVPWLAYESHHLLALVARDRGDVALALRECEEAISTVDLMQAGLATHLRPDFLVDKQDVYDEAIEHSLRLSQPQRAFDYLERGKSRALADFLAQNVDVRVRSTSGLSDKQAADELARLREEHNWLWNRLHASVLTHSPLGEVNPIEEEHLQRLIRDRERKIARALERMALRRANQLDLTGHFDEEHARHWVGDDEVLFEYHLHQRGGEIFVLGSQGLVVVPLDRSATDVVSLVRRWQLSLDGASRAVVAGESLAGLKRNAIGLLTRLYDILIKPAEVHLDRHKRLVVVPFGPLHSLPFQALHDGRQFLAERMEVSVCPSNSVLRLSSERVSHTQAGALVVGCSHEGRLPYVLDEARAVSRLLGVEACLEAEATCAVVIGQAAGKGVVHFAAHADARLDNPEFAHLQLAGGQLSTADVFNLNLDGALVTLSACETGRGVVSGGDEVIALSRGFLYAGAAAIVQSLWQVDDKVTAKLMEGFYRALCSGQTAGEALQTAQLAVAGSLDAHPYWWAAFQLIGSSTWRYPTASCGGSPMAQEATCRQKAG